MQKLAEICIRRPVFATMLITALLVVGLAAYRMAGVESGWRFPSPRRGLLAPGLGRARPGASMRRQPSPAPAQNTEIVSLISTIGSQMVVSLQSC